MLGRWPSRAPLARYFQRAIDDRLAHVRIQYRTPTQLGLLERFHQILKTEEVYWKLYTSPGEARESLAEFRVRYNQIRPHRALLPAGGGDVLTPVDVYLHGQAIELPRWQGWGQSSERETGRARAGRAPAREGRSRARARGHLMP
jgi:transposase InsO family protein